MRGVEELVPISVEKSAALAATAGSRAGGDRQRRRASWEQVFSFAGQPDGL